VRNYFCSRSDSQEIFRSLWNKKLHYRVERNPPLVLILSQMNPNSFKHYSPSDGRISVRGDTHIVLTILTIQQLLMFKFSYVHRSNRVKEKQSQK
jgi:hypothetical protein